MPFECTRITGPRGRPHLARLLAGLLCAGIAGSATARDPDPESASATRIEADVRFLADDLLEGREAGTRGHALAALYVANRFRGMGLEGAGDDGGFLQQVPLLSATRDPAGARFVLHGPNGDRAYDFESEFVPAVNFTLGHAEVEAPLSFVGFGVHAPELGYDDLAGVELAGRIAVLFTNAPATLPGDARAFHADTSVKFAELERRGAVGAILIEDPARAVSYPWARAAATWRTPAMRVRDAEGRPVDDFPGLRVRVSCSLASAGALFDGAPKSLDAVKAGLASGRPRSFALPGRATLATQATIRELASPNVVARLPGAHRTRAAEHLVFTAHLDHLGIGVPENGDAIHNGAMDNALGVAIMLEAAQRLAADARRPARSMLFVATTAEEKGLLGAEYYARNPTVPAGSMVAIINMDMPLALGGLTDVVPIGVEHTSLQAVASREIVRAGLKVSPDPFPEEVVFIRSDQYPFIKAGVPAVYLDGGTQPADGSNGIARQKRFLSDRYHQPDDDLSTPIDWPYAARLAGINYRIARAVAADARRPRWNEGDFFGERFGRR